MSVSINTTIAGGGAGTPDTPTFTGVVTQAGAEVTPANALSGTAIDVTKGLNTKSVAVDTTFTFSGTPSTDQIFGLMVSNTDTSGHTITIPSSQSLAQTGTTITTFWLPASGKAWLTWRYDGTNYQLIGDPPAYSNYAATTDPTVNDDSSKGHAVGSTIINTTTPNIFINEDITLGAAVWFWISRFKGQYTWATRPTTNLKDGAIINVTDVGTKGSDWIWNASDSRWYPAHNISLKQGTAAVNGTASASLQIVDYATFPGGMLWVGAQFDSQMGWSKSGTTNSSTHIRNYFGTGNVTPGTNNASLGWSVDSAVLATSTKLSYALWMRMGVISSTSMRVMGLAGGANPSYSGGTSGGAYNGIDATGLTDISNTQYLSAVIQMDGTTDTPILANWDVILLRP